MFITFRDVLIIREQTQTSKSNGVGDRGEFLVREGENQFQGVISTLSGRCVGVFSGILIRVISFF